MFRWSSTEIFRNFRIPDGKIFLAETETAISVWPVRCDSSLHPDFEGNLITRVKPLSRTLGFFFSAS